jgi:PAS domain-containing protein
MLMRQAAERTAIEAASIANATSANSGVAPTQLQQHPPPVAAAGPLSADNLTTSGASGTSALSSLTPQQISQAIVAAANSQGGRLDPALAQSLLYPAGLRGAASGLESVAATTPVPTLSASNNNILANTMQQLVIQQYLQAQANAQQQVQQQHQAQAQAAAAAVTTNGHQQAALLAMTLAAGKPGQPQQHFLPISAPTTTTSTAGAPDHRSSHGSSSAPQHQQQQAQAQAQAQALLQHAAQHQQQQLSAASFTSIKPASTAIHQQAQAIQQQYHFPNGAPASAGGGGATANLPSMIQIAAAGGRILPSAELAPQNSAVARAGVSMKDGENTNAARGSHGIKKQQKRAANRRSAQLSRKRKKQFIEELKEENDDLRRKEQILRAIPDLIVVFDSSGRLGFVSESVGRFLRVCPSKLEGTSFWDLICEESVRMLKAAFMDSLAAREADSDTAVLGAGVWELRLKDKNSKYMIVTLNGVVHFKGDAPECVCCIRPVREEQQQHKQQEQQTQEQQQKQPLPSKQQPKTDGIENIDNTESGGEANKSKNIRPVSCSDGDASRTSDGSNGTQQSVLNMSSAERDEAANDAKKRNKKFRRMMASAEDDDSQYSNDSNSNNVEADGTNNSVRISDGDSNDGIESD